MLGFEDMQVKVMIPVPERLDLNKESKAIKTFRMEPGLHCSGLSYNCNTDFLYRSERSSLAAPLPVVSPLTHIPAYIW